MQCYSPLHIVDLLSSKVVSVDTERLQTPFAFIFLYDRLTFLAFRKTEVVLWDLNGEMISHFEDHTLWFPPAAEDHTSVINITEKQDLVRAQGRGEEASQAKACHRIGTSPETFRDPTAIVYAGSSGGRVHGPPLRYISVRALCSSALFTGSPAAGLRQERFA
jgi:hypothetical protein